MANKRSDCPKPPNLTKRNHQLIPEEGWNLKTFYMNQGQIKMLPEALWRLMKNYLNRSEEVKHTVVQYPYTIEKQKKAVSDLLKINKMLDFKTIAGHSENKVHFVYNFLAVLEMLQQELIDIQIGLGYNNFWISAREI